MSEESIENLPSMLADLDKSNVEILEDHDSQSMTLVVKHDRTNLYGELMHNPQGDSMMALLQKEMVPAGGESAQGVNIGLKTHPFNFPALKLLKDYNEHHSTCIHAKTSATVGLGYLNEAEKERKQNPIPAVQPAPTAEGAAPAQPEAPPSMPIYQPSKADDALDPLCAISWNDVQMDACEDFWETGNGYVEVVRKGKEIKGLHFLPSVDTHIRVESNNHKFHYVIQGEGTTGDRVFAAFGDKEDFIRRAKDSSMIELKTENPDEISEVIHFRRPSSRSKWYGSPDWISAVPMIELCQMLHQFKFDFFNNRGVPEFMLFITGGKLGKKEWTTITDAIKANIGHGNSHKSLAVNIPQKDITIQLFKLAVEGGKEEDFKSLKETIALSVVTAHKTPPLLAGIQIPGKLGATNELSQALIAFQSLVIGQMQRLFQSTLARTLGTKDAGLGLEPEDFTYKTVTDDLDPDKMDKIGRMHQPLPEANAEGRDLDEGMKD